MNLNMRALLTRASGKTGAICVAAALMLALALRVIANEVESKTAVDEGPKEPAKFEKYLLELAASDRDRELVGGVTVGELADLRQTSPAECTRAGIFKRLYLCDMVRHEASVKDYCQRRLVHSARFCANQLLGQNEGQFHAVQRPMIKWLRLGRLTPNDRRLWEGLLKKPQDGDLERQVEHIDWEIYFEGYPLGRDQRRVFNLYEDERLSRDQLMKRLGEINSFDPRGLATHLSQAKDKAHMELVSGVTVADLLQMNDISHRYCQPEEVVRRNGQCYKLEPERQLRLFCRSAISSLIRSCLHGFREGDEVAMWWLGASEASNMNFLDVLLNVSETIKTKLELYLERNITEANAEYEEFMRQPKERGQVKAMFILLGDQRDEELFEGVTRGELADLRQTSPEECTRAGIFRRLYVCELVRQDATMLDYCQKCLAKAARFCARELLGQNEGQFNALQRPAIKQMRLGRMLPRDRQLWEGVLSVAPIEHEQMVEHLKWRINCRGDIKAWGERRVFELYEAERLSRDQLLEKIAESKQFDQSSLAAHLAQARDKAHTELVNGVTVADLLQMNDISQDHCRPEEVARRNEQCYKLDPMDKLRLLCREDIRTLTSSCLHNFKASDQVDVWWLGASLALEGNGGGLFDSSPVEQKTDLELYLERDIAEARHESEEMMKQPKESGQAEDETEVGEVTGGKGH